MDKSNIPTRRISSSSRKISRGGDSLSSNSALKYASTTSLNTLARDTPKSAPRESFVFNFVHTPSVDKNESDIPQDQQELDRVLNDLNQVIRDGDIIKLKELLLRNPNVEVTMTSKHGMSPMKCAILNDKPQIVSLLLNRVSVLACYNALVFSISVRNNEKTSLSILKHPLYQKVKSTELMTSESIQFSSGDVYSQSSPLIMAAKHGQYAIIRHFLEDGFSIAPPHPFECSCERCTEAVQLDELRFAQIRLETYQALSNEIYISISSSDPLLTAFELRQTLFANMEKEKHFRTAYTTLVDRLEQYSYDLLSNVNTEVELDSILNAGGFLSFEESLTNKERSLKRLKLAVENGEKMFVNHPVTQRKISLMWEGSFRKFRAILHKRFQPFASAFIFVVIPLFCVIDLFCHVKQIQKLLRSPCVKFMGQLLSFAILLLLIAGFSFSEVATSGPMSQFLDYDIHIYQGNISGRARNISDLKVRQFAGGSLEVILSIFIFALVWQECTQLYIAGFREHFNSIYNKIDFLALKLYLCWCVGRIFAFQKTLSAIEYFQNYNQSVILLSGGTEESMNLYWLIADRSSWHSMDPVFVSDGLFAIANIMTFSRVLYFLVANETLGPLYLTLTRIVKDISRFLVVFTIIFLAFLFSLSCLYWYYRPENLSQLGVTISGNDSAVTNTFGTYQSTAVRLFVAMFGEGDPKIFLNYHPDSIVDKIAIGIYGCYYAAMLSVLIPMLVAMMNSSFLKVQNRDAVEWKFARASLYMDFMEDDSIRPVPLNILPSPRGIFLFIKSSIRKMVVLCQSSFRRMRQDRKPYQTAAVTMRVATSAVIASLRLRHEEVVSPLEKQNVHQPDTKDEPKVMYDLLNEWEDETRRMSGVMSLLNYEKLTLIQKKELLFKTVMHDVVTRYLAHHKTDELTPVESKISQIQDEFVAFKEDLKRKLGTDTESLSDKMYDTKRKLKSIFAVHAK